MTKYSVGGFTFTDEQTAKKAAKELKAVEYIIKQLKDTDDTAARKIYDKIVLQNMFTTEVGLTFLKQLENNLKDLEKNNNQTKVIKNNAEIIDRQKVETKAYVTSQKKETVDNKELIKLKRINVILTVISITLGLCVLGMFYISSTINSPTILNYEEEILNKYSTWEQELSDREDAIREKEHSSE